MYKVDSKLLIEIKSLIDRADKAINNLERKTNNAMLYMDLKKDLQNMSEKINSRYVLDEFSDINSRDNKLNKTKAKIESKQ